MGAKVVHAEVLGQDGPALRRFYGEIFDWTFQVMEEMDYGLVDFGNGTGAGVGGSPDGQPHAIFYIEVPDPQATLDEVERRGGRTVMAPTEIPGIVTFATFADPAGNVVGIVKAA
jgi:predicted enzyme related to lactoylglutathione lyase